jgi:hypothetical protein
VKLPVIKSLVEFAQQNDQDYLLETLEVLEHLSGAKGLKDEELDVIGELISNICGAIEVDTQIAQGADSKKALNDFMQRVMGSIDR